MLSALLDRFRLLGGTIVQFQVHRNRERAAAFACDYRFEPLHELMFSVDMKASLRYRHDRHLSWTGAARSSADSRNTGRRRSVANATGFASLRSSKVNPSSIYLIPTKVNPSICPCPLKSKPK